MCRSSVSGRTSRVVLEAEVGLSTRIALPGCPRALCRSAACRAAAGRRPIDDAGHDEGQDEARDPADYVDLRHLVERAELPWDEARGALEDAAAAKVAADNAADLNGVGLWGVPSFRVGDLVIWGQDRLPLLADRLRRHTLATT